MNYQLAKKRLKDAGFIDGESYERSLINKIVNCLNKYDKEGAWNALVQWGKKQAIADDSIWVGGLTPINKAYFMRDVAGDYDYPFPKGSDEEKRVTRANQKDMFGSKKRSEIAHGNKGIISNNFNHYRKIGENIKNSIKDIISDDIEEVDVLDKTKSYLSLIPEKIILTFNFKNNNKIRVSLDVKSMEFDNSDTNKLMGMIGNNNQKLEKAKKIITNIIKSELKLMEKENLANKDYRLYLINNRTSGKKYENNVSRLRYEEYYPNYFPY